MPSQLQLRDRFSNTIGERQPERQKYFAWIGHPDGTIDVPEKPGYVWIRTSDDKIKQAYCAGAIPLYNNPVRVAYTDEHENTLVILERDVERFPPNDSGDSSTFPGGSQLGPHHTQHEPGGGDEVYIGPRQLLSLGARPQATPNMTVYVEKGFYPFDDNFNWWPGGNSSDMTAQIPASAGQFLFRIVYIDATTNALAYVNSSTSDDPLGFDYEALLTLIPTNACPSAAIKLTNGMTTITEGDIYDIRIIVDSSPGTVAAGGGSGVLWDNVIIVANTGGDYSTLGGGLTAAVSGDLVWGAPKTYAEALTHKAGVYLRGMGQAGSVIVAPAAGIPLTMPASGSCIIEQMRLSPSSGQVAISFPAASTAILIAHWMDVDANGAASIDSSTAAATASIIFRGSTIDGDVNIKSIATFYDTNIGGSVTQSASAGALTIYGGRIAGNLTTVAGSTISLHDLPTILGTVSGAGTIVGAYLNSSGNIIFVNGTAISGRANPSATIGLAAVNGVATTVMASDAAPALSQAIIPTWSGLHTFNAGLDVQIDDAITMNGKRALITETGADTVLHIGGLASSFALIRFSNTAIGTVLDLSSNVNVIGVNLDIQSGDLQLNTTTRISNAGAATLTNVTDSALTSGRVVLASTGGLLADDADLTFSGSTLSVGTDDTTAGIINVYGQAAGSTVGGSLRLYNAADHDATFEYWNVNSSSANFQVVSSDSVSTFNILVGGSNSMQYIVEDAGTTNTLTMNTFRHSTTGTPDVGFGIAQIFQLESTTTVGNNAATMGITWVDATHASRKARWVFNINDTAQREVLRLEASGSAAMIGFLGAAAVARPAAYTQTYSTATRTHANPTASDPGTYAAGANGYSTGALAQALFNSVEALVVDVANVKQVLNQVIDDLQSFGLLA